MSNELAERIAGRLLVDLGPVVTDYDANDAAHNVAALIEELGYRKPRTIKSAAALEALPFGSAVQTSDASDVVVLRSDGRNFRNQSGFELPVEALWRYGTQPFTVIYEAVAP